MEADEWCFSAPQFYDFTLSDAEQEQGFLFDDYFDPNRVENWGGFDQSPVRGALPSDESEQAVEAQPTVSHVQSQPSAARARTAPALAPSPPRVPNPDALSPASPHLPLADVLYLPIGEGSSEARSPTRPIIADPAPVRAVSIDASVDTPLELLLRRASSDEDDAGCAVTGDFSSQRGRGSVGACTSGDATGSGAPVPSPPASRLSTPLLGVGASGRVSAFSSRDLLGSSSSGANAPPVFISRLSSGAALPLPLTASPLAVVGTPGVAQASPPLAPPPAASPSVEEGLGAGAPQEAAAEVAVTVEPSVADEATDAPGEGAVFASPAPLAPERSSFGEVEPTSATPKRARVWVSPACSAAKPPPQEQSAAVLGGPSQLASPRRTPVAGPASSSSVLRLEAAATLTSSAASKAREGGMQSPFRTPNAAPAAPLRMPTPGGSPAVATPLMARHLQPAAVPVASPLRTVIKRPAVDPHSGTSAGLTPSVASSVVVAAKPRKGGGMLKLAAHVLVAKKTAASSQAAAAASASRAVDVHAVPLAESAAPTVIPTPLPEPAAIEAQASGAASPASVPAPQTEVAAETAVAVVSPGAPSAASAAETLHVNEAVVQSPQLQGEANDIAAVVIPSSTAEIAPSSAASLTADSTLPLNMLAELAEAAAPAFAASPAGTLSADIPEPPAVAAQATAAAAEAQAPAQQQPRGLAALAARIGRGDAAPKRAAQRVPVIAPATATAGASVAASGGVSKLRALAAKSVVSFTSKLPARVAVVAAQAVDTAAAAAATAAVHAAAGAEDSDGHAAMSKAALLSAPLRIAFASHAPPAIAAGGIVLAAKPSATIPQPFKFSTAERAKQHLHAAHGAAEENYAAAAATVGIPGAAAAAGETAGALPRPARRASSQAAQPHDVRPVPASAAPPAAAERAPPQPPSRAASATAVYGRHGSRLLYLQRLQQQVAAAAAGRAGGGAEAVVAAQAPLLPGDAANAQTPTGKRARGLRQSMQGAAAAAAGDALDATTPPRRDSHAPLPSSTPLLSVEERARHRAALEAARVARLEEAAAAAAAASEARRAAEEAELRILREARTFRARPLDPRIFEAPPAAAAGVGRAPRAHSKPATVARSPSLATKARSRRVSTAAAAPPPAPGQPAAIAAAEDAAPPAAAVAPSADLPGLQPALDAAGGGGAPAVPAAAATGPVERGPGLTARKANVPTGAPSAGAKQPQPSAMHARRAAQVAGAAGQS